MIKYKLFITLAFICGLLMPNQAQVRPIFWPATITVKTELLVKKNDVKTELNIKLIKKIKSKYGYLAIAQASKTPEVGADTILAVIATESRGHEKATGSRGERGLMQIKPGKDATKLYDPKYNIRAGTSLIKAKLKKYGRLDLALLAYSRGDGSMRKYLRCGNDPMNNAYVKKVMSYLKLFNELA